MIKIDGSVLEGGGQILRMALSLSAILKKPVTISKIRAGRSKPGLAAQHLKGVELLGEICKASVKGASLGSTEVEFCPQAISNGVYYADPRTAGCISLLIQIVLPVTYFADGPIILELKGGTNCIMAPQIDFVTEVFRPNLEKFGCSFDFDLKRRGYFPRGGGHCMVEIKPVKSIAPVNITNFGQVQKLYGWSFVAGTLPVKVAQEMADGAQRTFERSQSNVRNINIECYKEDHSMAPDNCSGIILACETSTGCIIGGSGLGNRNERANETGANAIKEILTVVESRACVDEHVQDQLIIFMALASGESQIRTGPLTLHTKTAIHVAELMTEAKFTIEEDGQTVVIKCKGIGAKNERI